MWSFLAKGPSKELSKYDIGEIKLIPNEYSFWTIHKGKNKATGDEVSIFAFEFKSHNENEIKLAKNAYKRLKTLRHPGLLTFLDGFENDSCIYIVTAAIERLSTSLYDQPNNPSKFTKSTFSSSDWGLFKLASLLNFLNCDCNMVHNNISSQSIYLDKASEWKLFGLESAYNLKSTDNSGTMTVPTKPRVLVKYEPPEISRNPNYYIENSSNPSWSIDIWGFACLIWEVFNGELKQKSQLSDTSKIPKDLVPLYCEMMNSNPKSRLSPAQFLEKSRSGKTGYLNTPCLSAMIFLDEIQMKDSNDKKKFFSTTLPPLLDSFSPDICKHKILPQIVQAFEYCEAGTAILPSLIKLGNTISADAAAYDKLVKPSLIKLFASTDRHTRMALLKRLPEFQDKLNAQTVNDHVFSPVITGFFDTNPLVKEATIKAMIYLAPKLNYNNLNVELIKHFARLQGTDPQGGIRTNTTVCMGKIAPYFDPKIRQKILISAFTRPFKDEFVACRQAGLQALLATAQFYTVEDIGKKILPSICPLMLDADKGVRDLAFEVLEDFLRKLKDVSENPDKLAEINNLAMSTKFPVDIDSDPISAPQSAYKIGQASKVALTWVSTLLTSKLYGNAQSNGSGTCDDKSDKMTNSASESNLNKPSGQIKNGVIDNASMKEEKNRGKKDYTEDFEIETTGEGDMLEMEDDEAWEGLEDLNLNARTELFFSSFTNKEGRQIDFNESESWSTSSATNDNRDINQKNPRKSIAQSQKHGLDKTLDSILKEEGLGRDDQTSLLRHNKNRNISAPLTDGSDHYNPKTSKFDNAPKNVATRKNQLVKDDPWSSWAFD
ncbi:unnamed protein product [Gordionus sp. m RMFG-2023]|uniref:N-terminal kinase-like protein n=1 Tax=Gordionus sp. m RMFG-2023 TaxID=3053472 RepID=UPI0030E45F5D